MGWIRHSLRVSFGDAMFYAVMFGLGDSFLNPFIVALNATPLEIGLLFALPILASSLAQYWAENVTASLGRKRTVTLFVFLQAWLWAPILLVALVDIGRRPIWLVCFVTVYTTLGALANPAWFSMMSQYIPAAKRGRYFSFRNTWVGAVTLVSSFGGGLVLWLAGARQMTGFAILFGMALACRLVSWWFLTRMEEPRLPMARAGRDIPLLGPGGNMNFSVFALFSALFSASVYTCAPFFPRYMLRELGFSYLLFVTINATMSIFVLIFLGSWGKHADSVGNLQVLRLTAFMASFIPALWILSPSVPYLLLVNALAGFAWGGYNLVLANFVFDLAPPESRVKAYAAFTLMNGIGICFGSLAGGLLIPRLPVLAGSRYHAAFVLSSALRLLCWFFLLPRIREVRRVASTSSPRLLVDVLGLRGVWGTIRGITPFEE